MPVLAGRLVNFSQPKLRLRNVLVHCILQREKNSLFGENSSIIALLKLKSNRLLGELFECNQPLNDGTYYRKKLLFARFGTNQSIVH